MKLTPDQKEGELRITPKGKKFLYECLLDGKVVATRLSVNPGYVAALRFDSFREFYFGRMDLVGKGESKHSLDYYIRRNVEVALFVLKS